MEFFFLLGVFNFLFYKICFRLNFDGFILILTPDLCEQRLYLVLMNDQCLLKKKQIESSNISCISAN